MTVCGLASSTCSALVSPPQSAVAKLAVDPRAGKLFIAAHSRARESFPYGGIFPYTMDGRRVEEAAVQCWESRG